MGNFLYTLEDNMEDLTITEGYMLLVLNKKGRFSILKVEENICLFISGILELLLNDFIIIKNEEIFLNKKLTKKYEYLKPLVETIRNTKNKVTMKYISKKYIGLLKKKKLTEYFNAVGSSLINKDYAKKIRTSYISKSKIGYLPYEKSVKQLISKITQEVLNNNNINNDYAVILALIKSCDHLHNHFSKIETDKLKDISNNSKFTEFKKLLRYIDDIIDIIINSSIL